VHGGVSFTTGVVGQAFSFNGSSSYVDLGTGADIVGTGPFAVGAWIKTTADGVIINQRDAANYNGEYVLAVVGGKVSWSTFGNNQYGFNFTSNATVADGNWHYVVGVREADGTGQIYIDGKLDSSQAAAPVPLGSGFHVYLGEDVRDAVDIGPGAGANFVGQIDEVRIYNRALAQSDVQALYANPGTILTTDQRGGVRQAGSGVDIGATEYQYDLAITGSAPALVGSKNLITYTLTVTNNGPDAVSNVTLTDKLPSSVTFQSLTAPQGWTVTTPAVGKGGTITATDSASLASGASATFTLVVQARPTTQGTVISDTATVSPGTYDPVTSNNTVTLSSTVPTMAAVGVEFLVQPGSAVAGQVISPAVEVAVVDANGNIVVGSSQVITLAIASGPSGAKLGGTTGVQAVNGVATFNNLTLSEAGTYTLKATSGKLTRAVSKKFAVSAPPSPFDGII
jgi:uncharacterized repeat protein (TIGR01451 family)